MTRSGRRTGWFAGSSPFVVSLDSSGRRRNAAAVPDDLAGQFLPGRLERVFGLELPLLGDVSYYSPYPKPYTFEVVAFGDEEGVRFGVSMLGSRGLAGRFDASVLERRDAGGIALRDALLAFGGDPAGIPALARGRIAAFVERHIEQGPVLLDAGLPVGVVTSIAGGSRVRVRVEGVAGHAGTVPMPARQDALAAAAEMVLAFERH